MSAKKPSRRARSALTTVSKKNNLLSGTWLKLRPFPEHESECETGSRVGVLGSTTMDPMSVKTHVMDGWMDE